MSAPPLPHWLPMRNPSQFQAVMQRGQVAARTAHFVLHVLRWPAVQVPSAASPAPALRLFAAACGMYRGAVVPKRWARRAVTRNLIKRQIRHVLDAPRPVLPGSLAVVVRQRAAFDPCHFVSASSPALRTAVRAELLDLLAQPDWPALPMLQAPLLKTARVVPAAKSAGGPSGTIRPSP